MASRVCPASAVQRRGKAVEVDAIVVNVAMAGIGHRQPLGAWQHAAQPFTVHGRDERVTQPVHQQHTALYAWQGGVGAIQSFPFLLFCYSKAQDNHVGRGS